MKGPLRRDRSNVGGTISHCPSSNNRPLFTTTLSFLSSRAKPRDLQFSGPFLETANSYSQTKLSSRLPRRAVGPERSVVEKSAVFF
jgi:hypothetical protein